jgi:hypothetical protein
MEKSVRRVTVVQGSGENRQANVVYKSDDEEEGESSPALNKLEKYVRHYLKAQVIGAQDAYQRHVDAVAKGGNSWIVEEPFNQMKARRKAQKEMKKAPSFFSLMNPGDDDEDEGDK